MKFGALILGVIVSILLLAAAGALYTMAGSNGGQQYRTSIDLVRQIRQLSSIWSIEIARLVLGHQGQLAAGPGHCDPYHPAHRHPQPLRLRSFSTIGRMSNRTTRDQGSTGQQAR